MEENNSPDVDSVSTNKGVSEKSSRLVTEGHPLMNLVVLDNIIRYLNYKDLKSIRLVCQRWNEVSANVFWKLSKIAVEDKSSRNMLENKFEELAPEENQNLADSFESTFPPSAGFPSNTIEFYGSVNRREVEYFWKQRGSLTLTNVYFNFFWEPANETIDLNHYITPKLTTLNIRASLETKFTVSLKMLGNIQNLTLMGCEILLDGKIVTRELHLLFCSVIYEGNLIKPEDPGSRNGQKILINNFVDFSKINKLILEDNFWRLDVGGDMKELERLSLTNIELVGLDNSQWKANSIDIGKSLFCIGDRMEIKAISGLNSAGPVDLESLPKTLEHLWFDNPGSFYFHRHPLICAYPKLTHLKIRIYLNYTFRILDFTNCTSLIDFNFSFISGVYQMDFNRIKLPNCIKNVKLENVIPTSDVHWQLDTLILFDYSFSSVKSVLHRFTTTNLVIDLDCTSELVSEEDVEFIINHWRNSSIEQLAIGYLDVDVIDRYFLFTNKSNEKGVAIDWNTFVRLCRLKSPKQWQFY